MSVRQAPSPGARTRPAAARSRRCPTSPPPRVAVRTSQSSMWKGPSWQARPGSDPPRPLDCRSDPRWLSMSQPHPKRQREVWAAHWRHPHFATSCMPRPAPTAAPPRFEPAYASSSSRETHHLPHWCPTRTTVKKSPSALCLPHLGCHGWHWEVTHGADVLLLCGAQAWH